MSKWILGIDISKNTFDTALLKDEKIRHEVFDNNLKGFKALSKWLRGTDVDLVQACMEATGRYGDALARYLFMSGHEVSMVNPKRIKRYAESQMRRSKTDKVDAAIIADFCKTQSVRLWEPPDQAYIEMQAMVRHLKSLKDMKQQEKNRLKSMVPSKVVTKTIKQHITYLDKQIDKLTEKINQFIDQDPHLKAQKELLLSIPGIGEITAAKLLAEIQDVNRFEDSRQLAAYTGLTPILETSGSSVNRQRGLSKYGRSQFREALYFPAISARKYNPIIRTFCERLEEKGKPGKVIICAAMHKLLRQVYGVLKHQQPFDPNHLEKMIVSA